MILVTGDAGFIGSHFVKELTARGEAVVGFEAHDVDYPIDLDGIDLIIHNGAVSSTTETDLYRLWKYNVDFSIRLFQEAAKYNIPVKYASSAAVYGKNSGIGFSYADVGPLNQYAMSKLTVDYWVLDHLDELGPIQGFRYFNVYGTNEIHKGDQASPVSKFSWQAKRDGVIKVFEDSERFYRDFVWVGDVATCVLDNNFGTGIYDVGTSEPISFQHVAELVARKYDVPVQHVPFPDHLKNKYQAYTCAKQENWPITFNFKTVKEYLNV